VCADCGLVVTKTADPLVTKAGHDVTYTITVENTGTNCDLTLVNVNDTILGDLTSSFSATLVSGASETQTFTYTVQEGDPDPLVNTVTFLYTDAFGGMQSGFDTATVDLLHPGFSLTQECLTSPVPPGEMGEFGVTIENTGDVDLIITTSTTEFPGPFTVAAGATYTNSTFAPCENDEACSSIEVLGVLPPEYNLDNEYTASDYDCCMCEEGEGRWTGGGTISWDATIPEGAHVTHGFEFRCSLRPPNNLQVNWGKTERFHMTELISASCYMNPDLPPPDPPEAPINEIYGHGVGRYKNQRDYTIDFYFTDVGEPGENDFARILITAPDGTVVLQVEGTLEYGNHQAHRDNKDYSIFYAPGDKAVGEEHAASEIQLPSESKEGLIPTEVSSQSSPNPFRDNVQIFYALPHDGAVDIDVFDVTGRHIARLVHEVRSAGTHQVGWNGRTDDNSPVPAGVYFYRVRFDDETLLRKMMIMK
jgi:uncharacterized repeat protein (TIGR01451 family)